MKKRIKKQKKNFFKKIIGTVLIFLALFFQPVKADYWGATLPANIFEVLMTEAINTFKETILSNMQKVAINLVMDRVRALLFGRSGGRSLVIRDYGDFILGRSERAAKNATGDIFRTVGSKTSGITRAIYQEIDSSVRSEVNGELMPTIEEIVDGGAPNVFDESKGGSWDAFAEVALNPANNAYDLDIIALRTQEEIYQRHLIAQQAEASSGGGFEGQKDENGLINLPGKVVESIASFSETLQMRMITNAKSIGAVIGQMAAQTISSALQEGINKTMSPIDNKLKQVNKSVTGGYNQVKKDVYNEIDFNGR